MNGFKIIFAVFSLFILQMTAYCESDFFSPKKINSIYANERIGIMSMSDNSSSDVSSSDVSSDGSSKKKITVENPFKDTNWDWFSEKYRAEKVILSVGIVSIAIGTPILFVGIFEYFLPQSDKSEVAETAYLCLIGVGSGTMTVGITLTIVGAVSLNYRQRRDKIEISMSIDL